MEQQKKIDDLKNRFVEQHKSLARTDDQIPSLFASLTELRQRAHAKLSTCSKEKLRKEIELRTEQKAALKIQLRMIELEEDYKQLGRLQKEHEESKKKVEKMEDQLNSLSRDLLYFKREEQALDLKITEANVIIGEIAVMDAIVSSLQDRLKVLKSEKTDLIADQIKRINAQAKLDLKIYELTWQENRVLFDKTNFEYVISHC